MVVTMSKWPLKVCSRIVFSWESDASRLPSDEKATTLT